MLVKLKNYLDVKRGPGLPSEFYSEKGTLIRLTLGNFNYPNGGFKQNTSKKDIYYIGPIKDEYILNKDDLITPLTEQVVGLLGETAWIPESKKYIQNGDIGLVIPAENKLDKKYCYYLLSSPLIKKQLSAGAQQTKIRHTSPDKIKDCVAPIPNINLQKKIGNLLYMIDEQIEKNSNMVEKLQVLALNTFDYFAKDNDISNSVILKDIIIEKEKSPIQVNDIIGNTGNIPFYTSGESILYTNNHLTDGFNIFLSTGGNAKVQSYYGKVSYSTDTWCISAKNELQYYLFGYLKKIESQMDKLYFHGTGLKHLQKPIFLKSIITIPDKELLKKYNDIVKLLYVKISNIRKNTINLQNIKNSLLPLLINQQLI